jgi:excisionase family DNA binding protein
MPSPVPEVLTLYEAAELLRCSPATVARAVHAGVFPTFRLARRILIPREALLANAFRVKDQP